MAKMVIWAAAAQAGSSDVELTCLSDSPPQVETPVRVGDALYWSTRRAISRYVSLGDAQVSTYEVVSEWHRVSAMIEHRGQLMWADRLQGGVWRLGE